VKRKNALDEILTAKALRRKQLAKLPFREKIKLLVRLQQMAAGVKKPGDERPKRVWMIVPKVHQKSR